MSNGSLTKYSYDGLNRPTAVYTACNATAQTYATAATVADDTVVQQVVNTWDAASNLTFQATSQRDHNATGTGALNGPGGAQPQARVSYVANYPDPIGRPATTANYGTNAGVPMTPPSVAPAPSDTILVSYAGYDSAGNLATVTDPQGTVTQSSFDDAGRPTQKVENAGGLNKTTAFTYAACGKIGTLTATNATTGNQVTTWVYGSTLSDSGVASNELLHAKVYPDSSSGSDQVVYGYNRLGQVTQQTAQTGTVRQFVYDQLGRKQTDKVITLGSGVDGTIQQIAYGYEVRGMLQNVTSYDSPTGGSVVNDVQLAYNDFQQLQTDYQSHSGAVNTSTTPNVAYAYADGSANTIRLNSVTYPNARALSYYYGATNSIDDLLSRVANLGDSATPSMAAYTKLGLDTTVIVAYPQLDIKMTYVALSGEPVGDAGDIYTGLDRFGRVIDTRWINSSNVDINRILYTFSRASNRLTINNSVTGFDQTCAYDGLYQLGECASTAATEEFDYDPTGNWASYINGANTQNRTHQTANEITSITGTPSAAVGYDANGNTNTLPQVGNWSNTQTAVWDAWNRLISVSSSGTAVGTYQYDGLNRRTTKQSMESGTPTTRHYYYSNKWQVLEERVNTSPSADVQYVWGTRYEDDIVLRDRFGGTTDRFYALADYFQPTAIADTSGVVQETYTYSAFGTPLSSSAYGWEYLYGSYYYDVETGLYQVRNRYYHSALGRWLSRDPLEDAELSQGANLYWYVQNNAVNRVDPSGLASASGAIGLIVQTALDNLLQCPSLFKCPSPCKICCQTKAAAGIALLGPVAGDVAAWCLVFIELPWLLAACELSVLAAVALAINQLNIAEKQCEASCPQAS